MYLRSKTFNIIIVVDLCVESKDNFVSIEHSPSMMTVTMFQVDSGAIVWHE